MDAVVSVAPRKDLINQENICEMDMNVNECQVTISIQLQLDEIAGSHSGSGPDSVSGAGSNTPLLSPWSSVSQCTRNSFMNSFVEQILELRETVYLNRFDFDFDNEINGNHSNHSSRVMSDDGSLKSGGAMESGGKSGRGSHAVTTQPTQEAVKGRRVSGGVGGGSGFNSNISSAGGEVYSSSNSSNSAAYPVSSAPAGGGPEGGGDKSAAVTKSRSQKVTNEAALLRNHIASKEFELARLKKVMSKRKDSSGLIGSRSTSPLPPSSHKRAISPHPPSSAPSVPSQHNKISSKPSPVVMSRPDSSTTPSGGSNSKHTSGGNTTPSSMASAIAIKQDQEQEQRQEEVNRSHDLIEELNILKGKYYRLTDIDYDKQQSRRLINRRSSKATAAAAAAADLRKESSTEDDVSTISLSAAVYQSKPIIAAHVPMTPAAKSLRNIQQKDTSPSLTSLVYPMSDAVAPPEPEKASEEPVLYDLRHPPYWTIIR
jgi:hypothetical protein